MPHTNSILVIHPNGTFYAQRNKVAHIGDNPKRGYWQDIGKTVLVLLSVKDDEPANGYEYGGAKSYDRRATAEACDLRCKTVIRVPMEERDRTGIPVRQPGGAQVMQLKPLGNKKRGMSGGLPEDKLWRPERRKREVKSVAVLSVNES